MSPKKSFLERMGLIEPAKPAVEVGKKSQSDGERRVLGDVKLKRQPAEPMARSTEGQPVSQNVVELEKLRKEMESAVNDYNRKSAERHEGRDTSFDNDLSKMRESVVDETYEDGVLDPTPQFNFDEADLEDKAVESKAVADENKPKFFFNDSSLEDQVDKLLGINTKEANKAVKESSVESMTVETKTGVGDEAEEATLKPSDVLEELVQESAASPFNEFEEKSQVPTQPQDTFSLLGKMGERAEEEEAEMMEEPEEEVKPSDVLEELVQEPVASPFNEFVSRVEPASAPQSETELEMDATHSRSVDAIEEQQSLLLMNQASLPSQRQDDRFKEEIEEQIHEKIHEQIEEKFEKYREEKFEKDREDKKGLKEELKKELELEWKREIKEELRQELRKDIKEEVIQDVAQDVNLFKDEITSKVAEKQEEISKAVESKMLNANSQDMKSDWDVELSGKTSKTDMHTAYMDNQFVEETVEDAVVEVVEPTVAEKDEYIEDFMKEYQEGDASEYEELESRQTMYVEDVQERGRSAKTMERNRMSEETTNSRVQEEVESRANTANTINVKQEFTSTAASAFKPDLHIGEKLDLIIGQYEKNKLQSIEDIYKNSRMETDTKKTIFMADVFLKAIPANLPQDVKRETVLNILKISGIELDSLLGDAYQRIDSLNKVLEDTISTSNEIFKRNEDTIHELERRIQDLNEINVNRAKFQEDQNTMVEYEIQKIINLVEFVKPKSR